MAEAILVASEVGGRAGEAILEIAERAFTEGIIVTGIAGGAVMLLAAIWSVVTLRGAAADIDLAVDHDDALR